MHLKFKYWWNNRFYFINFLDDNLSEKFMEYECRAKTSPLLQYTGSMLNGVEVYIGDVLYFDAEDVFDVVIYDSKNGYLACKNNDIDILNGEVTDWTRIVGNVYSNPELIKRI